MIYLLLIQLTFTEWGAGGESIHFIRLGIIKERTAEEQVVKGEGNKVGMLREHT